MNANCLTIFTTLVQVSFSKEISNTRVFNLTVFSKGEIAFKDILLGFLFVNFRQNNLLVEKLVKFQAFVVSELVVGFGVQQKGTLSIGI